MIDEAFHTTLKGLANLNVDFGNLTEKDREFLKGLINKDAFGFQIGYTLSYYGYITDLSLTDHLGNLQDQRMVENNDNIKEAYTYQIVFILDELAKGNIPDSYLIAAAKIEWDILKGIKPKTPPGAWTSDYSIRHDSRHIRKEFRSTTLDDYIKERSNSTD